MHTDLMAASCAGMAGDERYAIFRKFLQPLKFGDSLTTTRGDNDTSGLPIDGAEGFLHNPRFGWTPAHT